MKRKIISVGIIAAFAFWLLCGCGDNNATNQNESSVAETTGSDLASEGESAAAETNNPAGENKTKESFFKQAMKENENKTDGSVYKEIIERREKQDLENIDTDNLDPVLNLHVYILAESEDDIHDIESIINANFELEPFLCGDNIYYCVAYVDDPIETIKKAYTDERVLFAEPVTIGFDC